MIQIIESLLNSDITTKSTSKMKIKIIVSLLIVLIGTGAGIAAITLSSYDDVSLETSLSDSEAYDIPINVYEIWDSTAIVIHGNVDKQDESSPVSIQIKDMSGNTIESGKVVPDGAGRFVYGISKFVPEGFDIKRTWNNTESYDVFATYKYPIMDNSLKVDIFNNTPLQKDKIPLTPEQIANMSHRQIIDTIKKWNDIGGNSPFEVILIIGLDEKYSIGQHMPFFIQKSGYGNPCYDQGVMIFDANTKENVGVNFYLGFCNPDKDDMEPFDYMVPYNADGFPKIKPITEPGEYVMVAATSDISNKVKQRFYVEDTGFVYDYNIKYALQKGSSENTKTMKIDLNSGNITIKNNDGVKTTASLDIDTLNGLLSDIDRNEIATNPLNSMGYGEFCDTCNFGYIKLSIGDTVVNQMLWDDSKPDPEAAQFRSPDKDSSTYFSMVDCIASKNGLERSWIGDDDLPLEKYTESQMSCNDLISPFQMSESIKPYSKLDYDFWVNDNPIKTPSSQDRSGNLGSAHEHASILVKIFGDKFDFSKPEYQIKSPRIHFEGNDGNTIHRHSTDISLDFLFDSIGIGLDDQCYVFVDGREFCTTDEYSLKFYVNGEQVDSITDYVIFQGDRILISYGYEKDKEIREQLAELDMQEIVS